MATQRLSLDPQLWNRTRRAAFDKGISASKLVEEAISEYLAKDGKPRGSTAASGPLPDLFPVQREGSETVHMEIRTDGGLVLAAGPAVLDHKPFEDDGPVVSSSDVSPKVNLGAVIRTPEEAAKAAASIPRRPAFHPVPKPVATKKTMHR